jgi:hypothetical protein
MDILLSDSESPALETGCFQDSLTSEERLAVFFLCLYLSFGKFEQELQKY